MDTMPAPANGADPLKATPPAGIFLYHPALCQMALPVRASKGPWGRDVGTANVAIDMAETGLSLPSGKFLRLLLLAMLDAAARSGDTRVDMGASSPEFVSRLGLVFNPAQLRALAEQVDRLVAARIAISIDGGPTFSVFDGRSRPVQDASGWRPALKLNAKFLAHFLEKAIPLNRRAALALWETPSALDAFVAIAFVTAELPPGEVAMTGWDDLLARFGTKGQDMDSFRVQFAADIQAVQPHAPTLALSVGDEGVEIRMLAAAGAPPLASSSTAVPTSNPTPVSTEVPLEQSLEEALMALPEPDAPTSLADLAEPDFTIADLEPPDMAPAPVPAPAPAAVVAAQEVARQTAPPAERARHDRAPPVRTAVPPDDDAVPQGHSRRAGRMIALKSHLTGLQQVIWLQRAAGRGDPLVEVTPGGRYDPAVVTVLALEPVVVQIAGGLYQRDFDRVSSWTMANRDLIDSFWFDEIDDIDDINAKVKKVPAPGWRE